MSTYYIILPSMMSAWFSLTSFYTWLWSHFSLLWTHLLQNNTVTLNHLHLILLVQELLLQYLVLQCLCLYFTLGDGWVAMQVTYPSHVTNVEFTYAEDYIFCLSTFTVCGSKDTLHKMKLCLAKYKHVQHPICISFHLWKSPTHRILMVMRWSGRTLPI
jgi:hypothetical protein